MLRNDETLYLLDAATHGSLVVIPRRWPMAIGVFKEADSSEDIVNEKTKNAAILGPRCFEKVSAFSIK